MLCGRGRVRAEGNNNNIINKASILTTSNHSSMTRMCSMTHAIMRAMPTRPNPRYSLPTHIRRHRRQCPPQPGLRQALLMERACREHPPRALQHAWQWTWMPAPWLHASAGPSSTAPKVMKFVVEIRRGAFVHLRASSLASGSRLPTLAWTHIRHGLLE